MRILHLSWDTGFKQSGGGTHEWNLSKAFSELGHEVKLVCEGKKDTHYEDNVLVENINWSGSKFKILVLFFKAILVTVKNLVSFKPSVVYERYRILGGYGVVIGKLFGKATILEVNDPTVDAPYIEGRINNVVKTLLGLWERFVFKCCDRIVTHHEVMVKRADSSKVLVVTNAADVNKFSPYNEYTRKWSDKFVCGFVGTFAEWQGVDTILETASMIKDDNVLFVLVGSEGEDTRNVKFLGRVDYDKIPELMNGFDVGLYVPNVNEYEPMKRLGFYFSPLKVFEYMSMGLPVIVSDVGNLKSIVRNGFNGYRINCGDCTGLKNRVLELKFFMGKRFSMGFCNRRACENCYNWVNVAEKILRDYGNVSY